jgi:hypothetical protein
MSRDGRGPAFAVKVTTRSASSNAGHMTVKQPDEAPRAARQLKNRVSKPVLAYFQGFELCL